MKKTGVIKTRQITKMSSSLLPEDFSNISLRIPVKNWSFEKIAENEQQKKRRLTVKQVTGTTFLATKIQMLTKVNMLSEVTAHHNA